MLPNPAPVEAEKELLEILTDSGILISKYPVVEQALLAWRDKARYRPVIVKIFGKNGELNQQHTVISQGHFKRLEHFPITITGLEIDFEPAQTSNGAKDEQV